MRKAGAKDYKNYSKKILKICNNKPVSLEVFADQLEKMKQQGIKINSWGKSVYVKIPVVNSRGEFTGKVIRDLNNRNIKLNITAVYTANQTKKILRSINKKSKVIISLFVGRAADTGKDPIPELKRSINLAKKQGCHIKTVPTTKKKKIEKFGKTFDKLTKETVKNFLIDSKKAEFKIQRLVAGDGFEPSTFRL